MHAGNSRHGLFLRQRIELCTISKRDRLTLVTPRCGHIKVVCGCTADESLISADLEVAGCRDKLTTRRRCLRVSEELGGGSETKH